MTIASPSAVFIRRQAAAGNILRLAALENILAAFHSAEIPVVVLKGAAHLLSIYDHPGDRPMTDIDLWLPFDSVERGGRILEKLGYDALLSEPGVYVLSGDRQTSVDLIHDIEFAPQDDYRKIWQNARRAPAGKTDAVILSTEDAFLYAVSHGLVHHAQWEAKWTADLARLAQAGIIWDNVIDNAAGWGLAEALWLLLEKNPEIFSPMTKLQQAALQRRLRPARLHWLRRAQEISVPGRGHMARLILQPRPMEALNNLLTFLFPSADFMRRRYAIPPPLSYLWRILDLARQGLRLLWASLGGRASHA